MMLLVSLELPLLMLLLLQDVVIRSNCKYCHGVYLNGLSTSEAAAVRAMRSLTVPVDKRVQAKLDFDMLALDSKDIGAARPTAALLYQVTGKS